MSNPSTTIVAGSPVIITKMVYTLKSNVPPTLVGKICTIEDIVWDGRRHNRYVASVTLRDKGGNKWSAVTDQLASLNPNYEPSGNMIVCTSCGGTFDEDHLIKVPHLKQKACPFCSTLECDKS
jgi:hypothetical protein